MANNMPKRIKKHKGKDIAAIAMCETGMTERQVAKELGVSTGTIWRWKSERRNGVVTAFDEEAIEASKRELVTDMYNNTKILTTEMMRPEKLEKASTLQLATSAGIMIDKCRAMNGESNKLEIEHFFSHVLNGLG